MARFRVLLGINLALLFGVALGFRTVHLGRVPGINGDEAWYGVQAARFLEGEPFPERTPSGNPLSPLYTGMDALLLMAFRPSFALLRVPALVCGIATVVLTYWLGRRVLDRATALIGAVLLAALPIAIGYSRFGWDTSQTPLVSLLAVYFALRGNGLGLACALVACLVVHPCNVFLLPAVLIPYGVAAWRRMQSGPGRWKWVVVEGCLLGLGVGAAVVWLVPLSRGAGNGAARLVDLGGWWLFFAHVGRLFSGVSIYEYIVGPGLSPGSVAIHDWGFWAIVLAACAAGLPGLVRARAWDRLALGLGLAGSLTGLYLVGGPEVIRPHFERYGMFLVVPGVVAFACLVRGSLGNCPEDGLDRRLAARRRSAITAGDLLRDPAHTADPSPGRRAADLSPRTGRGGERPPAREEGWAVSDRRCLVLVSAAAWALLLGFKAHYWDPMGARASHPTFRTGAWEPKARALALIARDDSRGARQRPAAGRRPCRIVAEDCWLYWPIQYLAPNRGPIEVTWLESPTWPAPRWSLVHGDPAAQRAHMLAELRAGAYLVGFADGLLPPPHAGATGVMDRVMKAEFRPDELRRWAVPDGNGRETVVVYRLRRESDGPAAMASAPAATALR